MLGFSIHRSVRSPVNGLMQKGRPCGRCSSPSGATLTRMSALPFEPRPVPAWNASTRLVATQALSRAAGAPLIGGNAIELLIDAAANYDAWLASIRAARTTGPWPTPGQNVAIAVQARAGMFSGQKGQVRHWVGRPS